MLALYLGFDSISDKHVVFILNSVIINEEEK